MCTCCRWKPKCVCHLYREKLGLAPFLYDSIRQTEDLPANSHLCKFKHITQKKKYSRLPNMPIIFLTSVFKCCCITTGQSRLDINPFSRIILFFLFVSRKIRPDFNLKTAPNSAPLPKLSSMHLALPISSCNPMTGDLGQLPGWVKSLPFWDNSFLSSRPLSKAHYLQLDEFRMGHMPVTVN